MTSAMASEVYQGYYGEFTITDHDRQGVWLYRGGLAIAALSFAVGTGLMLWQGNALWAQHLVTALYGVFCVALGISLAKIHIYLVPLHRLLQIFWGVGCAVAIALTLFGGQPLAVFVFEHPASIWGMGFTFAALTGIFFKEGFCFRRLETMLLTPLVPLLLMGHLTQIIPLEFAKVGFGLWSLLFVIFAARKFTQAPAADIGDKSVFDYLEQQKAT